MNLLYLSDTHFITPSAEAVFIMKMADAYTRNGHRVQVYAHVRDAAATDIHRYYGTSGAFGIRSYGYSRVPGVKRTLRVLHARRAATRVRPDLAYGRCLYALLAVARTRVPLVYEAHTPPASRAKARLCRRLFAQPGFRRLVVITEALRDHYLDAFGDGLRADQVVVAHDGADPVGELPPPPGGKRLQFGYIGSLLPGKGWETVLDLARALPEHDFHLVGGTPEEVAALRARGVSPNVHLHGHVPHSRVAEKLAGFDVALLPPLERVVVSGGEDIGRWMSPMKLFEYMAAGRPVVASGLPVIREVVHHGRNGWIAAPGDVEDWARALRTLAAEPGLRARLAEQARRDFLAHYTWQQRARRVLEGLDSQGGST